MEYALSIISQNLSDINSRNIKNFGSEVFVSKKSNQIAPYLFEKKILTLLEHSLNFMDSINLELFKLNDKRTEKYLEYQRLSDFLDRVKLIYLKSLALKACYEHERLLGVFNSDKSVSKKIKPYTNLLRKKKPRIFIKLNDSIFSKDFFERKIEVENLERNLNLVKNCGFIEAIILENDFNNNIKKNKEINGKEFKEFKELNADKNLNFLRKTMGENFTIISSGNIYNGNDVYKRIQNGADFVLLNKASFDKRGPYILEKIFEEINFEMEKNGEKNLRDIRANGIKNILKV